MKSKLFILLLFILIFSNTAIGDDHQPDPLILDAFDSVSIEEMTMDARVLCGEMEYDGNLILSRHVQHPHHNRAMEYLHQRLEVLGFEVWQENFDCSGPEDCANLVVEIPGLFNPDIYWIIGAHYDSTNGEDPTEPAPGAVDNSSGIIIVLQTLTALRDFGFSDSLRFILFDAEEVGLLGSEYHAKSARQRNDDIALMINLDVPGWRPGDINQVFSSSDLPSWPDLQIMNRIAPQYPIGTGHIGVPAPSIDSSDMASFWNEGYAGFLVGGLYALTGWMNTGMDTYEKLDVEHCVNVAKLIIAYVGERAGITDSPEPDDDDDDNDDDSDDVDDDDEADSNTGASVYDDGDGNNHGGCCG